MIYGDKELAGCCFHSIKKPSNISKKQRSIQEEQVIILSAAQAYQTAQEHRNLEQGVFSYFLLLGLKGKADKNKDHIITIGELHQFVFQNVKAYTQNQQVPHTFGSFDVDLPINF